MNYRNRTSVTCLAVACLLFAGSLSLIPFAVADDAVADVVPEPTIHEYIKYNYYDTRSDGTPNTDPTANHYNKTWTVDINHGNGIIKLGAGNYTNRDGEMVAYSQNIHYFVGSKLYIAMFQIHYIVIIVENQTLIVPLRTCEGFDVKYTPVKYDGPIPTLDVNITFERVRVYGGNHTDSSLDITLVNRFRGNWNQTDIKVEALFDFSNTKLYKWNGTELNSSEPFTAEVQYSMVLTDQQATTGDNRLRPADYNTTSMTYNIMLDNGSPLILSKLDMREDFTIYNATGSYAAVGYSSMSTSDGNSLVVQGFPGLKYNDTISMQSDPEIVYFHDRVGGIQSNQTVLIVVMVAIVAVAAIGTLIFMRKRNAQKKGGE